MPNIPLLNSVFCRENRGTGCHAPLLFLVLHLTSLDPNKTTSHSHCTVKAQLLYMATEEITGVLSEQSMLKGDVFFSLKAT